MTKTTDAATAAAATPEALSPADEAKLATDEKARSDASAKVLEDQLTQQAEARNAADVAERPAGTPSRAAHAGEGGGAWPAELLRERFIRPKPPLLTASPETAYTSHEQ